MEPHIFPDNQKIDRMRKDYDEASKQHEIEKQKRKELKEKRERERILEENGGIEISSDSDNAQKQPEHSVNIQQE